MLDASNKDTKTPQSSRKIMSEDTQHSQLSDAAGRFYIFGVFIGGTISIMISIILLTGYYSVYKIAKSNKYSRYALECAIISSIATIIASLIVIFTSNDLLIPWTKFDFVSITDSLGASIVFIGKIFFYIGFTFYSQSILKKDQINMCLKIWIIFVTIAESIAVIMWVIEDESQQSPKEIGIAQDNKFKIAMAWGHTQDVIQYVVISLITIDVAYFGVLLFILINGLKQVN